MTDISGRYFSIPKPDRNFFGFQHLQFHRFKFRNEIIKPMDIDWNCSPPSPPLVGFINADIATIIHLSRIN